MASEGTRGLPLASSLAHRCSNAIGRRSRIDRGAYACEETPTAVWRISAERLLRIQKFPVSDAVAEDKECVESGICPKTARVQPARRIQGPDERSTCSVSCSPPGYLRPSGGWVRDYI